MIACPRETAGRHPPGRVSSPGPPCGWPEGSIQLAPSATSELFDYTTVTPDAVRAGGEEAMRGADAILDALAAAPAGSRTFANTAAPLEAVAQLLGEASGRYGFLSQVSPHEETREVAFEYEERLATFATGIGFRQDVYEALKSFAAGGRARALDGPEARLLEHSLRDFRRNGMELSPRRRQRVRELKGRLIAIGIEFRRQIDEYDDAIVVTREQLTGLPDAYIDGLRQVEMDGETRFRVSLDYPEFYPFMESAEDESLRRELFLKNHNRAAGTNVALLEEALALRKEVATALGYDSWAAYVLEIKMAREPRAALDFLVDLEQRVRVKAERDLAELAQSKASHLGPEGGAGASVEIWDWRYYMQRVLREQHDVDQFEVAQYFPLEAVLDGLFDAYQRLVGVRFVAQADARAWHPDVRLFAVEDATDGRLIGHFYMDLHPRPHKFGHAAAFTLRGGRSLADGTYQAPVSAMVANFTKPAAGSPSLLRHSEVVTLFHEFGHILHQVMTRSPFLRFAGTSVERDFVEAPSQMLEHWCWEPSLLASFTRHHQSREPIPDRLVQRMVATKHVSSGIATLRQIYFARIDLAYHGPGEAADTDAVSRELHAITGFEFPEGTHFQAGFGHLFGYDAGYYGYLWSKVFGDDMFTRFEESGLEDAAVGRDYRRLILERGGVVDGDALVRDFLGREPNTDAFLRDLGLSEDPEPASAAE